MAFAVTSEHNGSSTTVHLAGELDLAAIPDFDGHMRHLLDGGHRRLILDLRDLAFCDSSGLASFVRGSHRCRDAGGWLRITGQQGRVARLLNLTGLDELLGAGPDG